MRSLPATLILATLWILASAAADEPAQPSSEVQVVETFEEAVESLFEEWLQLRPEVLKLVGLGTQGTAGPECLSGKGSNFFEFIECEDASPPRKTMIDVVRTDSLRSPFVGVIRVKVQEVCNVRRVVASLSMSKKKFEELSPSCLGKSFRECMDAGGRLAPKLSASSCTGGPGSSFSYQGDTELRYRWSKGAWEFETEKVEPPRQDSRDKA